MRRSPPLPRKATTMQALLHHPPALRGPSTASTPCGQLLGQYVPGGAIYLLTPCCGVLASSTPTGATCDGCSTELPAAHATTPHTPREMARTLRTLGCITPVECAVTTSWKVQTSTERNT